MLVKSFVVARWGSLHKGSMKYYEKDWKGVLLLEHHQRWFTLHVKESLAVGFLKVSMGYLVTWKVHFHLIHLNLIGHAVDRTATPHNPGHVIPQKAYNGVKGIWYVYMFLQHVAFNILQSWWVSHWPKRPFPWTRGPFGQIATPGRLLEHLERCALVGTCWEWRWSFLFLGKPMVEFKRHLFWEAPI